MRNFVPKNKPAIGDWSYEFFKKHEWTDKDELKLLDRGLLELADHVRISLKSVMIPSPAKGAFARTTGSKRSKHYAVGRLSTAGDFFIPSLSVEEIFVKMSMMEGLDGVGIGFYTNKSLYGNNVPMIHLDIRESKLIWFEDKSGRYFDSSQIARRL